MKIDLTIAIQYLKGRRDQRASQEHGRYTLLEHEGHHWWDIYIDLENINNRIITEGYPEADGVFEAARRAAASEIRAYLMATLNGEIGTTRRDD